MRLAVLATSVGVLALALAGLRGALAASVVMTGFSGYEISPGLRVGDTTYGVVLAGWTQGGNAADWVDSPGDEGKWATVVVYRGTPGLGRSVELLDGLWYWQHPDAPHQWGRLLAGSVRWPDQIEGDIGCGEGIARAEAHVSTALHTEAAGELSVCLDDTRPGLVWPPRAWGSLVLTGNSQ